MTPPLLRCLYDRLANLQSFSFKTRSVVYIFIFTMVSYFLRWTLLKTFNSIPNNYCQQTDKQLDRIACAVINTWNEARCLLLRKFYSRRILESVFVGSIVIIRNECLFSGLMGNDSEQGANKASDNRRFLLFKYCLTQDTYICPYNKKNFLF